MADLDTRIDECAPDLAQHLRVLETRVLSLLKTATGLGTVLIVTNAGDGWVELSSRRFLPAVCAFLEYNYKNIKIISARARYVDVYREHPLQWKSLTFSDELRQIFDATQQPAHPLNVLVLGDSVGDQYAAHVAANALMSAGMPLVLKVVKFLERPSIDQLCKELSVLLDHVQAMVAHNGAFDVSMYKESSMQPHQPDQQPVSPNSDFETQQHSTSQQLAHVKNAPDPIQPPSHKISPLTTASADAPLSPVSAMATCAAVL